MCSTDRARAYAHARLGASGEDEFIRAAIAAAHYNDPRASDYLTRALIDRRYRLVAR